MKLVAVRQQYETRKAQVDGYVSQLAVLEAGVVLHGDRGVVPLDPTFFKMAKAGALLAIYNLIEGTLRDSFIYLYDKASTEVSYKSASDKIRAIWIESEFAALHENGTGTHAGYLAKAQEAIQDILEERHLSLDRNTLKLSGSVTVERLEGLCAKHGIKTSKIQDAQGRITTVKEKRNNLAHGHESFEECGQQFTANDIREQQKVACIFVLKIIEAVEQYLAQPGYKRQ